MKPLFVAAVEVQEFLRRAGESFCFIGGIALQRWGEPRFATSTSADVPAWVEARAVDRVLSEFYSPRVEGARDFAQNRVILIQSTDIPIDVVLGALPFDSGASAMQAEFDFGLRPAFDNVLRGGSGHLKAFAGRLRDWADVVGVDAAIRSLDWALVLEELSPCRAARTPEISTSC